MEKNKCLKGVQPITIPPIETDRNGKLILESIKMKQIDFGKDFHPEFDGYITEQKGGVWISHISMKKIGDIGKGYFSKLIKELKYKYDFIKIPTPSKMITDRAIHLGFKLKREFFGEPYNETATILLWFSNKWMDENGNKA